MLACSARLVCAQDPETPSAGAPEVHLEAHDGKTQYRLGEPIQLDLVFPPASAGAYIVNATNYGDLADSVEITPKSGWVQWQGRSAHDYLAATPLASSAIRVPLVLNQGFVFREPGHYVVRVTTRRLSAGTGMLNMTDVGPLTTNSVGIDLVPMPAEAEAALVRTLQAEIASTQPDCRGRSSSARLHAAQQLVSLEGDDALRAKIALAVQEDCDLLGRFGEAIASTRNLQLQRTLLEQAWADPTQSPSFSILGGLQQTRALLRGDPLPGWAMLRAVPDPHSEAVQTTAKEHAADMDVLIRTLPARTGKNRSAALYLLIRDRGLTPAQMAVVKPLAIDDFAHMDTLQQRMLLETGIADIHDARLIPALRAMLERDATDKDALKDLIRFDPDGAKPYVIRAVCDRANVVPLEAVADLPSATVPEVDGCLSEMLRLPDTSYRWQIRAQLAARFASAAVLPAVRQGWTSPQGDGPVLALLLRYAPEEAVARLKTTDWHQYDIFFQIDRVFGARKAQFPPQLTAWLREVVRTGSPEVAGTAAYQLSRYGDPKDRALLEARLAQLRAAWEGREAEIASAEPQSEAGKAGRLEIELMSDLRGASLWTESDAEAADVARGCLSDQCRLRGRPRPASAPTLQ